MQLMSQESNVKCPMSDVKCQMSNAKCQMSNFKCQITTVKCQTPNAKCQISNVKIKFQMSNTNANVRANHYISLDLSRSCEISVDLVRSQ